MNKQGLIKKLKELLTTPSELEGYDFDFDDGYDFGIERAISLAEDLDDPVRPPEPKPLEIDKPVVPQFVADWYEEHKDYFESNLYNLCVDFHKRKLPDNLHGWFTKNNNKPIETLVMMHKFGYEVEKEKLYTVEIPNPNCAGGKIVLFKQDTTGRLILTMLYNSINKPTYLHLTEAEIKQDFEWAWQFAKEVKECNQKL